MKNRVNKKYQLKLVIIGSLCVIAGIIITGIGILFISQQSISQVSQDIGLKFVKQIQLNVDNNIEQIESLVFGLEIDQNIIEILKKTGTGHDLADSRVVESRLRQSEYLRSDVKGIYIIRRDGEVFYNQSSPSLVRNYQIEQEEWFEELQNEGELILGKHVPSRYLSDRSELISYMKIIRDWETREYLGTIIVDLELKIFEDIFKQLELDENQQVVILDSDGNIIYESSNQSFYDVLNPKKEYLDKESFTVSTGSNQYNIYSVKSEKVGWYITCCINLLEIVKSTRTTFTTTLMIIVVMVLLTVAILTLLMSKNFQIIERLREGMLKVRSGNYEVEVQANTKDEIGELCNTFNSMCKQLNYLVNTVKVLENKNKEIEIEKIREELNFLQAQINPHFIYNTLESISMMAELNDDEDARLMSSSLGRLLRISINRGQEEVAVREEIEHVKCYLAIQKIRYEERFEVIYHIQDKILECKIPKLILQPLVENAIYHGIEPLKSKGLIIIKGYLRDNFMIFEIQDNGLGMDKKTVDNLNEKVLAQSKEQLHETRSIGLINVNKRIKLFYRDERYGLTIKSEEGKGTKVCVLLPFEKGKQDEGSSA